MQLKKPILCDFVIESNIYINSSAVDSNSPNRNERLKGKERT